MVGHSARGGAGEWPRGRCSWRGRRVAARSVVQLCSGGGELKGVRVRIIGLDPGISVPVLSTRNGRREVRQGSDGGRRARTRERGGRVDGRPQAVQAELGVRGHGDHVGCAVPPPRLHSVPARLTLQVRLLRRTQLVRLGQDHLRSSKTTRDGCGSGRGWGLGRGQATQNGGSEG